MIVFPNGKLNLGLYITGKRPDNYHDISSVFLPAQICDALEIVEGSQDHFSLSGSAIDASSEENICLKALERMRVEHDIPALSIFLHKAIPSKAGLGGGSSDGVFMLKMLNDNFNLNLSRAKLMTMALDLGSDCPFFIDNTASLVGGRGDLIEEVHIPQLPEFVLIVKPDFGISTSEAFSHVPVHTQVPNLKNLLKSPPQSWRAAIRNTFEDYALKKFPELATIKSKLYDMGAVYASMSGSGTAFYGLFDREPKFAGEFERMFVWKGKLI